MSLIIPGGRPASLDLPTAVNYAYIVGVEPDGNAVIIPADSTKMTFKRQATPDDIYGAACLLIEDGVQGIVILMDEPGLAPYDAVFMVMAMPDGKILLSPDVFLKVNPSRDPSREQIFSSLSVLRANIEGVKASDMTMASLANQAAFAARMSQDEALKKELGLRG